MSDRLSDTPNPGCEQGDRAVGEGHGGVSRGQGTILGHDSCQLKQSTSLNAPTCEQTCRIL